MNSYSARYRKIFFVHTTTGISNVIYTEWKRKILEIFQKRYMEKNKGGRQSNGDQISGIRNGHNPDPGPQSDTIPEANTDK